MARHTITIHGRGVLLLVLVFSALLSSCGKTQADGGLDRLAGQDAVFTASFDSALTGGDDAGCEVVGAAKKTGGKRTFADSSNLLVSPGEKSLEEIIGGIERGVYVERLSGGAPSANGDLTAVAKNSFLIENGRIGKALNETMLSFNVADAIQNVVGISRETRSDGSGDEPWIAFDGATVSGK